MFEERRSPDGEPNLAQFLETLWRRRWTILLTILSALAVGWAVTGFISPTYEAEAKLLVRAAAPGISTINTENPLVDLLAMAQPETLETQLEILRSRPFRREVFASLPNIGDTPASISVDDIKDTNIVTVRVESPDPQVAADVANAMLEQYLKRTRAVSIHEIVQARHFVQKESEKARRALQRAEESLLRFRRTNRVAQLAAEQQNRTQELVELEAKSREANSNLLRLKAQIREVQEQLERQPRERVIHSAVENPRIGVMRTRIAEATVERETLLQSYRPNSTRIRTLDAQIASLHKLLSQEPAELRVPKTVANARHDQLLARLDSYQTDLEGWQAQAAHLTAQLAKQRTRLNQLGPWEVRLTQLQRERELAEQLYLNLTAKLQDLQIRENARRSLARVLEPARAPGSPVRPQLSKNLVLALVLGLALGCALAFLLEYRDDRLKASDEVGRRLAVPVIGAIPPIADPSSTMSALPPASAALESFRWLRARIRLAAWERPLRSIAVTSPGCHEGKTTTVLNLGLAMAMDGLRVILVDADLRSPSLHERLGLPHSPGLSEVLRGEASLEEVLQSVPEHNVRVLPGGQPQPNSAELLNSVRMDAVLEDLGTQADIVLFDTPPCLGVTDAHVIGNRLDAVLLVAEIGSTRRMDLEYARELLETARIHILGVVFNRLRQRNGGGCGYRYPYGLNGDTGREASGTVSGRFPT
jgi:succinoglycan biosynthesis transport protein ExoP